MKTIAHIKYGPPDLLQYKVVDKPAPKENRVLIKVLAASVNAGDWRGMRADPFFIRFVGGGILNPKDPRLGSDLAGVVEEVGETVTQFHPGDEVFGCGHGSFAEFALAREDYLAAKPASVSFEEAAATPVAALTALQGLRDSGRIQPGQEVLIQGASGGVGTFAVQLAKLFGAEVTAVCSTRNLDMAREMGADEVIDYKKEDFTRREKRYDLIFAVNGYQPLSAYKRALKPNGKYVCAGGTMSQFFQSILLGPVLSIVGDKKLGTMGIAKVIQADLVYLGELVEARKIVPWIDQTFPLSQVPEAIRYVEDKHASGKVVISMEDGA
jgi:NADPH:quinone reductase-like Zn-dependent oxidoreductase